jgi:hypothetical protein
MKNKIILHLAPFYLLSLSCQSMEEINDKAIVIKSSSIQAPHHLGKLSIFHDDNKGFHVLKDGKKHDVKNYNLDKALQKVKSEKLKKFQKIGFFSINQLENGEFTVKTHVRGKGGGPVLAGFCYWMTKALGYGVPVALGTGAVIATLPVSAGAGVASGATAGAGTIIKIGSSVAIKGMVGGSFVATGGATVLANTVVATVGTTAATNAAATGIAVSTASAGGYIGFVEGLATAVWIWAMAAPTP